MKAKCEATMSPTTIAYMAGKSLNRNTHRRVCEMRALGFAPDERTLQRNFHWPGMYWNEAYQCAFGGGRPTRIGHFGVRFTARGVKKRLRLGTRVLLGYRHRRLPGGRGCTR